MQMTFGNYSQKVGKWVVAKSLEYRYVYSGWFIKVMVIMLTNYDKGGGCEESYFN